MAENEDHELRRLRMERMQNLLKQKEIAEARSKVVIPTVETKLDQLQQVLLQPDALSYLNQIKMQDDKTYWAIRNAIFPPEILRELDLLLNYLRMGMIRQGIINLTEIQYLERQVKGIGTSITVKRQGKDATSLAGFLKEED